MDSNHRSLVMSRRMSEGGAIKNRLNVRQGLPTRVVVDLGGQIVNRTNSSTVLQAIV